MTQLNHAMNNRFAFERLYRKAPPQTVDELVRFRATHPTKHTVVSGVPWEYLVAGRGTDALLVLPGLLGFGEMSFQLIGAFEPRYRVIAPSYPAGLTTMRQLVAGVLTVLDVAGVQVAQVLGGSYGGMVAQCLVRRYPQRVRSLVLSHTGGPNPDRAITNRRFLTLLRWLPLSLLRLMLKGATRKSLKDAPEHIPFWEAYSNEMLAHLNKDDLLSRYQAAIDFDANAAFTPEDLRDWPGRILILEGDNDPVAEAPARETLKALHPQAQVHTFHGSGHVASIERLDEYTAVIASFLQDH